MKSKYIFLNYNLSQLLDYYKTNNLTINLNKIVINNIDILDELLEKTKFLNDYYSNVSINQRLYHVWFNVYNVRVCPICNNSCKFNVFRKTNEYEGYYKTCNIKECIDKLRTSSIEIGMLNKYGVKNSAQCEEIKCKKSETIFKKYGVKNISQSKLIKEKKKQTSLKNNGIECVLQLIDVKTKGMLERYGVENASQSKEIKDKKIETCLENYGVENPFQSKEIKDKIKQNNLEKYGVEYLSQNLEIFLKQQLNRFKFKSYILPSVKEVKIQGYENKFLDEYFLNGGLESNIIIDNREIEKHLGIIWYITDDGKNHRYYPDCYLINENKIIEVKSTYTIKCDVSVNELKRQACLDKGLNFEFKIYK